MKDSQTITDALAEARCLAKELTLSKLPNRRSALVDTVSAIKRLRAAIKRAIEATDVRD